MQFVLISRRLIHEVKKKGEFFQGPFPDYYAMTAMFLTASRILIYPVPMVTIAITKKSHGYFVFNRLESEAGTFLNSSVDKDIDSLLVDIILPGAHINNGWLITMEVVRKRFGKEFDIKPSYPRYRALQYLYVRRNYLEGRIDAQSWKEFEQRLNHNEQFASSLLSWCTALLPSNQKLRIQTKLEQLMAQLPQWWPKRHPGQFRNMLEVFHSIDPIKDESVPLY